MQSISWYLHFVGSFNECEKSMGQSGREDVVYSYMTVYMADSLTGWIGGFPGSILKTTDGGSSMACAVFRLRPNRGYTNQVS